MVNLQNGNGSKTNMWTSVTYLVRKCRHPTSAMQLWIPWKHEEDPRRMSQFTRKYEWSSDFIDYSFSDDSYRCWITVPCITIHIKTQLSHLHLKWHIFPSWEILIQADSLHKKRSKSLTSPTSFWFPGEPVAKRLLHQWWGPWINVKLWGFHLEAVKFHPFHPGTPVRQVFTGSTLQVPSWSHQRLSTNMVFVGCNILIK